MIDGMMRYGFSANAQVTSGGPAVVDQGNAASRLIAPSGITRGIPFRGGSNEGATIDGRVSLGFLQVVVVLLVVSYIWTRNVQGGG